MTPSTPPSRRRFVRLLIGGLLFAFLGVNILAWRHARSFTQFRAGGARTSDPEQLSTREKIGVLLSGPSVPRPRNRRTPGDDGLAFTTHRFPGARGIELEAWRISGPGAVALLFHGYAGCKDALLPAAREWRALGFDTWLVDFHGSGGSAGGTTSFGWDEADDVAAAARAALALRPGAPLVLHGTSMGAAALLRAVHLRTVEPAALVLECPYDRLLTTVGHRFHAMGLPAFPCAHALIFWGGVQRGFDGFALNPVEYARTVRCPTLLMDGDRDTRVGWAEAQAIAAALGPHGTFKVFRGCGHDFYLRERPDEWRRALREFLAAQRVN